MTITRRNLRGLELEAARWEAVLDTARDAVVSIDGQGLITLFNKAAEEIFGYPASEVLGKKVNLLMPSPYREEHDSYIERYRTTGVARAIGKIRSVHGRHKNGELFPIELSVSEARVRDDVVHSAIIRDITEREAVIARLDTRTRQQATVAELGLVAPKLSLPDLLTDSVRRVAETLSIEYVKILELLPDDTLLLRAGVGWHDGLVGHATVGTDLDSQAGFTLVSSEPVVVEDLRTESRFRGPQLLRDHEVVSGMSVIIFAGREPYGIFGVHTRESRAFSGDDINFLQAVAHFVGDGVDRLRAQQQLEQARKVAAQNERLADVGAIAAKIVHDVGNPLAGLSMSAENLKRRLSRDETVSTDVFSRPMDRILSTVNRLSGLVGEFKDFLRDQQLRLADIELDDFLQDLVASWEEEAAAHGIELQRNQAADLPRIHADGPKLRRVLDNLIKNAIEAIDEGPGTITVRAQIPDAETVSISVEDSGPGLPDGLDVFALFETTKVHGSGLGLPIARQILDAHGGGIEFANCDPHGTKFILELPRRGPAAM